MLSKHAAGRPMLGSAASIPVAARRRRKTMFKLGRVSTETRGGGVFPIEPETGDLLSA
jgi:hypothetical protein